MSMIACESIALTSYTLLMALRDLDANDSRDRRARLEVEFRVIYAPVVDGWCQRFIPRGDEAACAATTIMDKQEVKLLEPESSDGQGGQP